MQEQEAVRLLISYRETLRLLEKRRKSIADGAVRCIRRLEILDEEISEVAEVIYALRQYAHLVT